MMKCRHFAVAYQCLLSLEGGVTENKVSFESNVRFIVGFVGDSDCSNIIP